jgi:signal transduction histidine kinase/tetratricopeptide (TPR) repeat protein
MKKNLGAALLLLILAINVCAQDTLLVDSLNNVVASSDSDYEVNKVFDLLGQALEKLPKDQAIRKSKYALQQAMKNDREIVVVFAYRNIARVYNAYGQRDEALRNYQLAITAAQATPEKPFGLAISYFHFGQFLSQQGLLSEGLQNLLDASKIFESLKMLSYVTLCHYEAAIIHYNARNYKQCIEEGYTVLSYQEKLRTEDQNYDFEFQRMSILNTIALANNQLHQYEIAIINYDKAELVARKLKNDFWIGLINGNKAIVFKNLGRIDEALISLKADFETSKKYHVWGSAGMSALSLSDIYLNRKEYDKSELMLDSALVFLLRDPDRITAKKGLSTYLNNYARLKAAMKEYPAAFNAMLKHVELRDSLSHEQEALNMAKIKATYDLDRKQTEIELLTKNNEIQQERIRGQKTLFIATLVVLILVVLLSLNLVYIFRRQKQVAKLLRQQRDEIEAKNAELEAQGTKLQENNQYIQSLNAKLEEKVAARTRELEETNHELDTFLYHSSHDIRRPITTLLGLDLVARQVSKDQEVISLFDRVGDTARSMDNMLFKMQMMYELNQPNPPASLVDINRVIRGVLQHFRPELDRVGMASRLSLTESLFIVSNPALLNIIFRNLIENAIFFRKNQAGAEPFIDIAVNVIGDQLEVSLTDNGIGIEAKYHDQVFDLYFRGSQASKGNGLGLYLVKKSIQSLNGRINLISDYGVGSTFTILLPGVKMD